MPVPGDKRAAVPFACLRLSLGALQGVLLSVANTAVTFARLRLSLGGPRGLLCSAAGYGSSEGLEDAGGQGMCARFCGSPRVTTALTRFLAAETVKGRSGHSGLDERSLAEFASFGFDGISVRACGFRESVGDCYFDCDLLGEHSLVVLAPVFAHAHVFRKACWLRFWQRCCNCCKGAVFRIGP